jgi:hypothetical protein
MKIKKFNEKFNQNLEVKVKDIIDYLKKLDPETPVYLDNNGWDYNSGTTGLEIVENSYLFHVWKGEKSEPRLTINN